MDTRVYVKVGSVRLETNLHTKTTDKHQYLHQESCHPPHTQAGIPYGQALRLRRICSEDQNFEKHAANLVEHFQHRGYDPTEIEKAVDRARSVPRTDASQAKNQRPHGTSSCYIPPEFSSAEKDPKTS